MSKKHEKVLEGIFSDHVSGNLHWREVEAMLEHYGAEFSETRGARVTVRLRGGEITLHRPHHSAAMSKTELHHLKQFLEAVGITS